MTSSARRPTAHRPAPVPKPLAPALPLGLRLKAFVLTELQEAQALLGQDGDARHTGVHQARKRLRRARAALAIGRKPLGKAARRLDEELGRLCRGLSPLRDAQALIEGLRRLPVDEPGPLGSALPQMVAIATQRRDDCLARTLARDPGLGRRRGRLQAMTARVESLAWEKVKPANVAKAVARSEKRLAKARRRAGRDPGDDALWHAMRRRIRRLRQQDHLLAALEPSLRPAESVSAEEAALLGEAQDDALLLRHCRSPSPFPPPLRALLRAEARARLARVRRPPAASKA